MIILCTRRDLQCANGGEEYYAYVIYYTIIIPYTTVHNIILRVSRYNIIYTCTSVYTGEPSESNLLYQIDIYFVIATTSAEVAEMHRSRSVE